MKFEQDLETLIIDPTIGIIKDYHIKFDENFDNLLYLAQTRSYSNDNDYHTFILFEKEGIIYSFHEFDNPQHMSFFVELEESSVENFFELLDSFDQLNKEKFFHNARIHYNYLNLNSELKNTNNEKVKKVKM